MPNSPEPDRGTTESRHEPSGEEDTQSYPPIFTDPETETVVISKPDPENDSETMNPEDRRERQFTAPGFDAKETQIIATGPEAATEIFRTYPIPPPITISSKTAVPQSIPPRTKVKMQSFKQRKWGWILAVTVIVLTLGAIAVLGTILLTRSKHTEVSQEDQVRHTIEAFDIAVQTGDLTALRSITCGTTRDGYVEYDERSWAETYRRVSAAKQYPVIAGIGQVVVNGGHAEANVTTFMAYDPQVRSTRSLDLQFRDDQWKICQSPSN